MSRLRSRFLASLALASISACGAAQPGALGKTDTCPTHSLAPVSSTASAPASSPNPKNIEGVADELLRRINAKDGAGLVASFDDSMRRHFPVEKTGSFIASLIDDKGAIESLSREPGGDDRHGVFRFHAERGDWRVEVRIDEEGRITEFGVTEAMPDREVPKSTLELALPYRGPWSVFWGGDTAALNAHIRSRTPSQLRAADLDVVDADDKTYRGSGKTNSDYYAYGREILAIADGVVTAVVDGVPENEPGEMNRLFVPGNLVVVRHADRLFSVYGHLQPGKMRVKPGASVKKGAILGLCGNSGNASEPHLHFQLQDGPLFEKSLPIEPVFKNVRVVRDGKPTRVAEYTFRKGDLVGDVAK